MATTGAARADAVWAGATQPSVAQPETAQFRAGPGAPGECDVIPVRAGSDESLFGTAADGIR